MFETLHIIFHCVTSRKNINMSKRKSSVSLRSNEKLVATIAIHLEKQQYLTFVSRHINKEIKQKYIKNIVSAGFEPIVS